MQANKNELRADFAELVDCFSKLPLAISIDNQWYDKITGKKLRENHVRCLIRANYLDRHDKLHGAKLDKLIKAMLRGVHKTAVEEFNKKKDKGLELIDAREDYL